MQSCPYANSQTSTVSNSGLLLQVQHPKLRPQLSVRADVGAVRATLLSRFAYDLAHFGAQAARLRAPAQAGAAAARTEPDQAPSPSYRSLFQVHVSLGTRVSHEHHPDGT